MNALRREIIKNFETAAGRHDDPAVFGGPPGDPGLLGPDSISWRIHSDMAAVSQAGLPAIVLEILHPSVIAGVQDHSNYRQDPFQRARATLGYVLTTTFGNSAAAIAVIDHVRHVHSFVTGTRPDGVAYRALDPELVTWVHTCIPWMILRSYEHHNGPLPAADKDRYLAEQAIIGRMGGGENVPTSRTELDAYVAAMRPKLGVNHQTREFLNYLLVAPFSPRLPGAADTAVHRFAIYAGMRYAPAWARELIGYDRPPLATRHLIDPFLSIDAKTLGWAMGVPACARMARQR